MPEMTDEDTLIWLDLAGRKPVRGWSLWMPVGYIEADKRDFDMMLSAQRLRREKGQDFVLQFGPVFICGAAERFTGLDELEAFL